MNDLFVSILYHVLIGIALSTFVWGCGNGLLLLFKKRNEAIDPSEILYGLPIGLMTASLIAFLFLFGTVAKFISVLFFIVTCIGYLRSAHSFHLLRLAGRGLLMTIVRSLLFIIGFTLMMGILFHGPTAKLGATPMGDEPYYALTFFSFKSFPSLLHITDMVNEGMHYPGLPNAAPMVTGTLFSHLPNFDPYLYLSVSLPLLFVINMIASLFLFRIHSIENRHDNKLPVCLFLSCILLIVAATHYPSWIVESPPVAYALPLTIVVYKLSQDNSISLRKYIILSLTILISTYFTKVMTIVPFGLILGGTFLKRYLIGFEKRVKILLIGLLGTAVVLYVYFLTRNFGAFAFSSISPLNFIPPLPIIFHIVNNNVSLKELLLSILNLGSPLRALNIHYLTFVGSSLLLIGLFRVRKDLYSVTILIGIYLVLARNMSSHILLGVSLIVLIIMMYSEADRFRAVSPLFLIAALILIIATFLKEPLYSSGKVQRMILTVMCLIFAPLFVLWLDSVKTKKIVSYAIIPLITLLVAVEARAPLKGVIVGQRGSGAFAPYDYDIWSKARKLIPIDGLIFTDWTGEEVSLKKGWNQYSALSERQVFIGGWYNNPKLRLNFNERSRRLHLNEQVLKGEISPVTLSYSRHYSTYFAVVRSAHVAPKNFQLMYKTPEYAIYQIMN